MVFLNKRIQVICNELKREAVRQSVPVTGLQAKKGFSAPGGRGGRPVALRPL